ncbi:multidrug efflux SMR transporter [bacterium]|nr:multidrug efflux SMR transporter [bacterium]
MHYLYLVIAIIAEVIATSLLKSTEEFTKPLLTVVVIVGYLISFYFLTLTLRVIPVSITYAAWTGLGVVLVSITAFFLYDQTLDLAAIIGITLIISGVVILNLFSKAVVH